MKTYDDIFLAVAFHKNYFTLNISKKLFSPIHVGKALSNSIELQIETDDKGENISHKNHNFCELTALYYMWKNIDAPYYGLMHYRRFFTTKENFYFCKKIIFNIKYGLRKKMKTFDNILFLKDEKETVSHLQNLNIYIRSFVKKNKNHIILPRKIFFKNLTLKEQFSQCHNLKDYEKIEQIIIRKYPEMKISVESVANQNYLYAYNMFIMNKEWFHNYMEWLFDILLEFEKEYEFTHDSYQDRIFGFLSERMLNIYVYHFRDTLKIKELDILQC